jgi:CRISPR/Cas system-associated exonuclease Cas4 (RecB family)
LENEKHQQEGVYFHRLAQHYLIGIPVEQISLLANTPNLQRWWGNFLNLEGLKDFRYRHPEINLSAPLGKFRMVAKYDLIGITDDGRIFIYDWKTYRKRPKNEWLHARMQTRVYRALLVAAGAHLNGDRRIQPGQIEMIYWFADFPAETARFVYQEDQFKRDWDALERLGREISEASAFPMTEDPVQCSFCPYRSYCNRGVRAGEALDAELETEPVETFDINFEQIGEVAF